MDPRQELNKTYYARKRWEFGNRKLVDDSRSVRKCWLHRRQWWQRNVPTVSVATVGNRLVHEYFWRRDQEAPREKQEKRDTEDLTYSRHVWRAVRRRGASGRLRAFSHFMANSSLPPNAPFCTPHTPSNRHYILQCNCWSLPAPTYCYIPCSSGTPACGGTMSGVLFFHTYPVPNILCPNNSNLHW